MPTVWQGQVATPAKPCLPSWWQQMGWMVPRASDPAAASRLEQLGPARPPARRFPEGYRL